jgi:hypothetical protein
MWLFGRNIQMYLKDHPSIALSAFVLFGALVGVGWFIISERTAKSKN